MQRSVTTLEQQPLMRVHRASLGRRDTKKGVVKKFDALQKAAMTHAEPNGIICCWRRTKIPSR